MLVSRLLIALFGWLNPDQHREYKRLREENRRLRHAVWVQYSNQHIMPLSGGSISFSKELLLLKLNPLPRWIAEHNVKSTSRERRAWQVW